MSRFRHITEAFLKGRFSVLLISLAVMLLVGPLIPGDQGSTDKLFGIFGLIVLTGCLRAVARTRRFFWFMLVLALFSLAAGTYEIFREGETESFEVTVLSIRIVYFVVAFFSIMRYVMDDSPVTGDKLCGAVAAYFVMGITWANVYTLFFLLDPGSFNVPEHLLSTGTINSTWTFYFSLTTLTTLGYGDITPIKPGVQSYAILEAATGQLFVAVIIARLIALQITHQKQGNVESETQDVGCGM